MSTAVAVPIYDRQGTRVAQTLVDKADLPLMADHRWYRCNTGYVAERPEHRKPRRHIATPRGALGRACDREKRRGRDARAKNVGTPVPKPDATAVGE